MDRSKYLEILRRNPRNIRWQRLVAHGAIDLGIWILAVLTRREAGWAWPLYGLLFAIFSFRAFGLMHDCVHGAATRNRSMNSLIGRLYGIFCFLPFSNWRQLHLAHHEWTGNVEKDPSMTLLVRFRAGNFHNSRWVRAAWRLWIPWLGLMQHVVFWRATVSQREFGFLAVLAAYFVLAAFAFGPAGLAFGLVLYLCGVEIVNFPHHLGFMQHEGGPRFAARDQHAFVRSCTYPRWIAHLILLNFNLHTEHHLFPTHPWYQLGVLHRELESAAGSRFNFSRASEWILHNRRRDIDEVFAESFVAPVTGNVRRAA